MKKLFIYLAILAALITALFGLASCGQTVEFNVNFIVDGETYSTVGTGGEEVIAIPENPTKEGYTFDGWYWDKDTWQTPFTANSLLDAPLSSDMNVYAKWKENEPPLPDLQGVEIRSKALTLTEDTLKVTLSNATETFSFLNDITVADGASYVVARDIGCEQTIASKTVSLEAGDNVYYILVTNGNEQKLYTATVRRRPMYTVSFNTNGGTAVASQTVEEGSYLTAPQEPTRIGVIFTGWNYDFANAIMENATITAKFNARDEMSNFIFSSTETRCTITGIKDETVTNITIPDYVTNITAGAFKGCTNLESITLPFIGGGKDASGFASHFGYIFGYAPGTSNNYQYWDSEARYTYYIPSTLKNITLTDNVTDIGYKAFANCNSITSVVIPNSVTKINSRAFNGCTNLTNLIIPDEITFIGIGAFYNCDSLTSIIIPVKVINLEDRVFQGCDNLISVTIGNSVTSIGDDAFSNCTNLTSIKFRGTQAQWNAITKGSNWNYSTGNYTITYNYTGQ